MLAESNGILVETSGMHRRWESGVYSLYKAVELIETEGSNDIEEDTEYPDSGYDPSEGKVSDQI